jgi:CcmD family protein
VQTAPGQSEFVPVKPGEGTEQLPAGPLVVIAYAIIWLALMGYLWTIWRRLGTVETEMRALGQKRSGGR